MKIDSVLLSALVIKLFLLIPKSWAFLYLSFSILHTHNFISFSDTKFHFNKNIFATFCPTCLNFMKIIFFQISMKWYRIDSTRKLILCPERIQWESKGAKLSVKDGNQGLYLPMFVIESSVLENQNGLIEDLEWRIDQSEVI